MDLFVLLAALRARIALFMLVLAVTVALAAVVSLWWPKSYRATASLVVAEPQQMQADILTSENVARRVVKALHLADSAEARAAYARKPHGGTFEDWLVSEWLVAPQISFSQGGVIRLQIDAPAAASAATIANAYAQAYLEFVRELQTSSTGRAEAVLDSRLATLRSDLKQAQERLSDYQREHGFISPDASVDLRQARLADLSAQLSKAQEQNIEQASRQQQVRQLRSQGASLDRLYEVQIDPQVQRLTAELQQGEARLQELGQQYGSAYPPYQRQAGENIRRRAALDAQINKVLAGIDNAAEQSRRRSAELEAEVAAQRARLLAVSPERGELATLVRNAESAQRTYDSAVQRFVVDMVGNEVFRSQASLLSAATVPLQPRSLRTGQLMVGAVGVGTLLGLGLIFLLELLNRRVRTVADLRGLSPDLAVPLLGVTSRWHAPQRPRLSGPPALTTPQPR